jgi:hypothetical protein
MALVTTAPGLPMAAEGGNMSPERRIIRWKSVKSSYAHDVDQLEEVG